MILYRIYYFVGGGVKVCCSYRWKDVSYCAFFLLYVAEAWKIDQLAQCLWYTDIMSDVSLRPESWFEWQTRLVWYTGLQDGDREEWREVARSIIDLLRSCEREHGKGFV